MLQPITLPALLELGASGYARRRGDSLPPDFSTTRDPDCERVSYICYGAERGYQGLKITPFGFSLYIVGPDSD